MGTRALVFACFLLLAAPAGAQQKTDRYGQHLRWLVDQYSEGRFRGAADVRLSDKDAADVTAEQKERLEALKAFVAPAAQVERRALEGAKQLTGTRQSFALLGKGKMTGRLVRASYSLTFRVAEVELRVSPTELTTEQVLALASRAPEPLAAEERELYLFLLGEGPAPAGIEIPKELAKAKVERKPLVLKASRSETQKKLFIARDQVRDGEHSAARVALVDVVKQSYRSLPADALLELARAYLGLGDRTWTGSVCETLAELRLDDEAKDAVKALQNRLEKELSDKEWSAATKRSKKHLKNPTAAVRATGVRMLGYGGRKDGVKTLAMLAADTDPLVEAAVRDTLRTYPSPMISAGIKPLLKKKGASPAGAFKLGRLLGLGLSPSDERGWKDLLDGGKLASRLGGIEAVGLRGELPVNLLEAPLSDKAWQVRAVALAAARQRADPNMYPLLKSRRRKEKGRLAGDMARAIEASGEAADDVPSYELLGLKLHSTRVVLLVRHSGGMGADLREETLTQLSSRIVEWKRPVKTRYDLMLVKLEDSLKTLPKNVSLNVVAFADAPEVLLPGLPKLNAKMKAKVLGDLAAIKPEGSAKLEPALEMALKIPAGGRAKSIFGGSAMKKGPDTLVLVDTGTYPKWKELRANIEDWNRVRQLRIHAVGTDKWSALKQFAEDHGGDYVLLSE